MLRASRDGSIGERTAIDDEDVDPSVTVVVEEQSTRSHRLDEMLVGARAVGVAKRDAGLLRDVDELRKRRVGVRNEPRRADEDQCDEGAPHRTAP